MDTAISALILSASVSTDKAYPIDVDMPIITVTNRMYFYGGDFEVIQPEKEITKTGSEGQRKRVVVVSSDLVFAEFVRSRMASEFDVLLAKNGGEAAAKAQAVHIDIALVDLGRPVLGITALTRMRDLSPVPVICALAKPDSSDAKSQFDFDYVLARPDKVYDLADRVHFILTKMEKSKLVS